MSVKVTDRETADGKKLRKMLGDFGKLEVRIGIQQGEASDEGVDLVDIAMFNELGTVHIPSRPFLRDSVDAHGDEINSFLQSMRNLIVKGNSAEDILKKIGVFQKGLVQQEIANGNFEENADITVEGGWMRNKKSGKPFYVEGKHSSRPLIDKGDLKKNVNYVIREKGASD